VGIVPINGVLALGFPMDGIMAIRVLTDAIILAMGALTTHGGIVVVQAFGLA